MMTVSRAPSRFSRHALLVWLLWVAASHSTGLQATEPGSLDGQLLGGLSVEPRTGVDADLFRDAPDPAPSSPGAGEESLERPWARELGRAGVSEEAHPLLAIARQMRDVQVRLARQAADADTTAMQEQIVAQLDMLMEQARNQAAPAGETARQAPPAADRQAPAPPDAQPGGNDGDPQQGAARQSTDEPGSGDPIDERPIEPGALQAMESLWNRLPQRQREQLLQLAPEQFLPKYEAEIEQYFRRLSEE